MPPTSESDPLAELQTEARNPASARLDELTSVELVALMNAEDATVAAAVATQSRARRSDVRRKRLDLGRRCSRCGCGVGCRGLGLPGRPRR